MRKVFLLLVMLVIISMSSVFAQTWDDYILEVRGDTVVVKDYVDMEQTASTLNQAIELDPNPFNPTTIISYKLPVKSHVKINVYDVLGREIHTLVNTEQNAGNHSATFNASNFSSGVYFYRLQAGTYHDTKKFLLVK